MWLWLRRVWLIYWTSNSMAFIPLRPEVSSITIINLCFPLGKLASWMKTPDSVTLATLKMRLVMSNSNAPYKTRKVSGLTMLGGIGWNFSSMGVGLMIFAVNLGAKSSIKGASLGAAALAAKGGFAAFEAFISSGVIRNCPAKTAVWNPRANKTKNWITVVLLFWLCGFLLQRACQEKAGLRNLCLLCLASVDQHLWRWGKPRLTQPYSGSTEGCKPQILEHLCVPPAWTSHAPNARFSWLRQGCLKEGDCFLWAWPSPNQIEPPSQRFWAEPQCSFDQCSWYCHLTQRAQVFQLTLLR